MPILEKRSTVTSVGYNEILANKLKPAICTKCQSLLSKQVLSFYDNTRPHISYTAETIEQLDSEFLDHPAYNPGLASSNYHLFGQFRHLLWGHWIVMKEVQEVVHKWLVSGWKLSFPVDYCSPNGLLLNPCLCFNKLQKKVRIQFLTYP